MVFSEVDLSIEFDNINLEAPTDFRNRLRKTEYTYGLFPNVFTIK